MQDLTKALWAALDHLIVHPGAADLVRRAVQVSRKWPGTDAIAWTPRYSLPTRLLLGGHVMHGEYPGEGWHPTDIDRALKSLEQSDRPARVAKLQDMLLCSSDRLILQSTCELWIRCIHDARIASSSTKAKWRLGQLSAPGQIRGSRRADRETMRMHFCKRIPQYTDEMFTVQREAQLAQHCPAHETRLVPVRG